MAKIKFENGVVVNFNGNPTPQDIEEVAQKLGISKKKSNFLTDVKESFKERVGSLSKGYERQMSGGQSMAESVLQTVGQGAGFLGDVAFSGASRLLSAATPDVIEKPIVKAGSNLLKKAVSTPLVSGAVSKYQQFAEEQPRAAANIGAVANIGSLFPVGKAGSVAGKVAGKTALKTAKVAGKVGGVVAEKGAGVAKFGLSQASGLNRETIEQIIKNPSLFNKKTVNELTRESLGKQVKQGIIKRIEDLKSVGNAYEPIRKVNQVIDVPIDTYTEPLAKYGLKLNNEGKILATAESKPFSVGELNQIEGFLQQYGGLQHTPNSALNAREALSNLAKYDMAKSNNLTSLAKSMRESFNNVIRNEKTGIKGLKAIDDIYSKETRILKDIKKDYFVKGTNDFKDNAISKISNLTKEGRQSVLARLKQIDPNIEKKVNILRAIEDIKASGGLKVGTYARGAAAVGGVATGNVGLILSALAAQPEILVPILRAWGRFRLTQKGFVSSLENKLSKGIKLATDEKSFVNQAINDYAKKIKNIKPGLSIQDVSKTPLKSNLINEAKSFKRDLTLSGNDKIVQEKSINKFINNKEKLVDEFIKDNGLVANTDNARKLFKDVGYTGGNSAAVHEASSALNKLVWKKVLKLAKTKEAILFSGGSGSGKSSVAEKFVSSLKRKNTAVLDSNLSGYNSAVTSIGEALKAKKIPRIVYIYREPVDAFIGTIKRMLTNPKEGGRIVPIKVTAGNHPDSLGVAKKIYQEYGNLINTKKLKFTFIDNSRGAGNAKKIGYNQVKNIEIPKDVESKMRKELEKIYKDGIIIKGKKYKITKEQYNQLIN